MTHKGLLFSALAAMALAACDGVAVTPVDGPAAVAAAPTVAPPSSVFGVTPEMLPQAIATGPALDLNWAQRYQANVPYVNTSPLPISVFSGPDGQDRISRLSPGNGGAINACAVEVDMCSISFGTDRVRGWVFMKDMAPQASAS